jgi:ATP-dependent RNA helicase DeaD
MPSFNDFSLQPAMRGALAKMDIIEPTPIQSEAIPALLAGRDLVGRSATGSGKTLAYGVPLVERLTKERVVQALVLVPTRELAVQINTVLSRLASSRRLTTALLVGGRAYGEQLRALRYGAQIVVGTPGRVQDHLERGTLVMSGLRMCVLDEADQMLDIGFAPVIEEILTNTPDARQMALFSATMPEWINKLREKFLKDPVNVDIIPAIGESTIEQIAYQVPQEQKMAALCTLLQSAEGESSLIFGRTKYGVEKLGKQLSNMGFTVGTLHGDKSQHAREKVLTAFRQGQVHTLLATNVAARGLDIKGIYQVINYELPESSDLFTHRIGRTGRMGTQGKAITLLVPSDVGKWRRMARNLGQSAIVQRLKIDEEAIVKVPPTSLGLEMTKDWEEERSGGERPGYSRRQFGQDREEERNGGERAARGRRQSPVDQGYERSGGERPARGRKSYSEGQEHSRPARSRPDNYAAAGMKRRQREDVESEMAVVERTPAWEVERERTVDQGRGRDTQSKRYEEQDRGESYPRTTIAGTNGSSRMGARDGRRGPGAEPRFGRSADKHKARPFVTTEPGQRVVRYGDVLARSVSLAVKGFV